MSAQGEDLVLTGFAFSIVSESEVFYIIYTYNNIYLWCEGVQSAGQYGSNIINKPTLSTCGPLGSGLRLRVCRMRRFLVYTTQCSTYINLSPTEFQIKLSSRSCRS